MWIEIISNFLIILILLEILAARNGSSSCVSNLKIMRPKKFECNSRRGWHKISQCYNNKGSLRKFVIMKLPVTKCEGKWKKRCERCKAFPTPFALRTGLGGELKSVGASREIIYKDLSNQRPHARGPQNRCARSTSRWIKLKDNVTPNPQFKYLTPCNKHGKRINSNYKNIVLSWDGTGTIMGNS